MQAINPAIHKLNKLFQGTSFEKDLNKLKWSLQIFCTENFIKTVDNQDKSN
jgi:hypothetical protein